MYFQSFRTFRDAFRDTGIIIGPFVCKMIAVVAECVMELLFTGARNLGPSFFGQGAIRL